MPHRTPLPLVRLIALFSFALAAAMPQLVCAADSDIGAKERKFREEVGLDHYPRVEYRDTKNAVITFEQFVALGSGVPFNIVKAKRDTDSYAVVSLQTPGDDAPPAYKIKVGTPFPAMALKTTAGLAVDKASIRGRYTLVSFYFSECAPCIKEIPMLNAFAAGHKDMGFLAATFDSADETKAFSEKTRFSWRTIANAQPFLDALGVNSFPSFALFDPKGVLVAIGSGGRDFELEKWVATAKAKKRS
jgi:thiol-disulfide isomerase/thioredoxin